MEEQAYICPHCDEIFDVYDVYFEHVTLCLPDEKTVFGVDCRDGSCEW